MNLRPSIHRVSAALALAAAFLLAPPPSAPAIPVIRHAPVATAEQGRPLGLRATVQDTSARIESVTLFYTTSKESTPFRAPMTSSGAELWFGTVPGHLVGPGPELFYYLQAENADGETRETPWQTVRVVAPASGSAATIPSASDVATRAAASSAPSRAAPAAVASTNAPPQNDNSKKYWVTAGIIVGGAVAVGGAIALAGGGGGGGGSGSGNSGGGGSGEVADGTFGGSFTTSFTPTDTTQTPSNESGPLSIYVTGSSVEIVGLWNTSITGSLSGTMFNAAKNLPAHGTYPAAYVTVSGQINGDYATGSVNGTSTDTARPGDFAGSFTATRH